MPHLSDLTRQILHDALFSALMLCAVLLIGFSSLTLRMHSSSLRRLRLLFNGLTLWFSRAPFVRLLSLNWLCHQKIVCVSPMREKETAICHYCLCARVTDGMQLIFRSKSEVGVLLLNRLWDVCGSLAFLPTGQKKSEMKHRRFHSAVVT